VFFPNWVNTDLFFPLNENEKLKKEFGFAAADKIVLYSGAIGEKQGLEAILEAAKALVNLPHLKFVICGSGPYKEKLKAQKESMQLTNVIFMPLQPYVQLNRFLNMADIHLVLQKANAADLVMPSKLTAILSVGGMSIITANAGSSLYDVVHSYDMGILIEPENPGALIEAIEFASNNNNSTIRQHARSYAATYLSIDEIFRKYTLQLQ
jgi:colanic acid biosynthesis glycosyl transferase WcaI